jgi:hypothetical protein
VVWLSGHGDAGFLIFFVIFLLSMQPSRALVVRACQANGYGVRSAWAWRAWGWLLSGSAAPRCLRHLRRTR